MTLEIAINSGLSYLYEECDEEDGYQNNTVGKERIHIGTCFRPHEIMTSLVALDLIGNLLDEETKSFLLHFLEPEAGKALVGPKNIYVISKNIYTEAATFPDETDATAVFMSVYLKLGLIEKNEQLMEVARMLIANVNKDGVIQDYLPPRGDWEGKVDAIVCCNAMRLLYTLGLGEEAEATEDFIFKFLESKKYLEPTDNYVSPDIFLLFLTRAINCNPKAKERFLELLTNAVRDRLGHRADNPYRKDKMKYTIDIAARIMTLDALGLLEDEELEEKLTIERRTLESLQEEDGSFTEDCLFKKEVMCAFYGGKVISTIFGVAALKCLAEHD